MKPTILKFGIPFALVALCCCTRAHAAAIVFSVPKTTVAQAQEFVVDVQFDPMQKTYNALEGSISFPQSLTLVKIEVGQSIIQYWVTHPSATGQVIAFAGIMPGGFGGVIDPFHSSLRLPGTIMRLVFTSDKAGGAALVATGASAALNDGLGTRESLATASTTVTTSDVLAPSTIALRDTTPPTLDAQIIQDRHLFDGKRALIFNATDSDSGIDHVEISENGEAFHTIANPYLLQNQSDNVILTVRAFDIAGNVATATITPSAKQQHRWFELSLLAVMALALLARIALYVHRKRRRTTA
jgi:hypothetical protein